MRDTQRPALGSRSFGAKMGKNPLPAYTPWFGETQSVEAGPQAKALQGRPRLHPGAQG